MSFFALLKSVLSNWSRKSARRSRPRRPHWDCCRLTVEALEDRITPALSVHDITTHLSYSTIQAAVNAANPNDVIQVDAGIYAENVVISTPLTLEATNNFGINPVTAGASRGAESIVEPGLNSSFDTDSVFVVEANNVTIEGFTIQGSIASPPVGQSAGFTLDSGTVVYAAAGISNSTNVNTGGSAPSTTDISGLTVQNNIIQDFTQVGVYGDTSAGTPSTGNTIADNVINDIPNNGNGGYYGEGVIVYDNFYADVTGNELTAVRTGIQTGNNYLSSGSFAPSISDNDVTAYVKGIYLNLQYSAASTFTISDNTITQADATVSPTYNVGLLIQSIQGASVQTNIQGNNISGFLYGVEFAGNDSTNPVTVQGGTLNANTYGVWDTNNDYLYPAPYDTTAALDGVNITNSTTAGVWVDSTSANSGGQFDTTDTTTLSILDGTSISSNPIGLLVDGALSLANVKQSTISTNGTGISVENGGTLTAVTQNFITGNIDGISIDGTAGTISAITDNDLSGNGGKAINNGLATLVDASVNWWGGNTSAAVQAAISGPVDYTPFLNSGKDTDLATPGFQGDYSVLDVDAQSPQAGSTGRIQEGVNDVTAGGTVNVLAGTYAENVVVNKSVTLIGAINTIPVGGPTGSPSVVEPGLNSSFDTDSVFVVEANNVTIEGFTIQGSIASPPAGQSAGFTLDSGTVVYAAAGISNSTNVNTGGSAPSTTDISDLTVQNNIIQDFTQVGVYGDTSDGTPSTGNIIADNLINDIPNNGNGGYYGEGVIIYDNFYADVTGNKITAVRTGIQTGNNYLSSGSFAPSISGNAVTAYVKGIYLNLQYSAASTFTISNNIITQADATVSPAYNVGLLIQSIQNSVQTNIQGNNISGFLYGVEFAGNDSTNPVTVQGGTLNANTYGVWDTNNDYLYPAPYDTTAALDGVNITNSTTAGVWVDSTSANSGGQFDTTDTTTLSILDGTSITSNPIGLLVDGALSLASVKQSTISTNETGVFVENGGALTAVTQNFITGNIDGISIDGTAGTISAITDNDLSGNGGKAINNGLATLVDASVNWWGGNTSAAVQAAISGPVDYTPFLNSGKDTDLATPGFQGDYSVLDVDAQSPQAGSTGRIQEGVNDVTAGGTVNVLAGTYAKNVTIAKNLTLAGVPGSPASAIVQPVGGDGITISAPATDVTVEDLEITGADNGINASGITTLNLADLVLTGNTAGGTISNVTTVNETPSSGSTPTTVTLTGSSFVSDTNQAIGYANVANFNVSGGSGSDTFNVTPAVSTTFTIHGNGPTPPASPGDTLNVDLSGTTSPTLTSTFDPSTGYSGAWTFGNRDAVNFDTIETLGSSVDLTVTQTISANPTAGQDVTYTVTVLNHGPEAATNVVLTDMIPAGTNFVSSSFLGYDPVTGQANLGTIAANDSVTGTIVVVPTNEGTISNTASVTSDEPDANLADNTNTLGPTNVADATMTGSSGATATGGIAGVTAAALSGATFTDANTFLPASDFTVTAVDWGDGSTDTTGLTITGSGGSYTVSGMHLYDEAGNYNFTITVADGGGMTATITGTATVADATLTGSSSATATGGIAGVTAATLNGATFTDTNTFAPSTDFTVTAVAWGDGSTDTTGLTVTGSGGSYTVSGTHLYDEAGNYNFTITVTDNAGSTATITGTATVADATLTGSSSATATGGIAGVTAATLSGATFTDANTSAPSTDFTVTAVAWGDGSTDTTGLTVTGSGGSYTVSGTHLYDEAGNYNFTITVTDNAGSTATITGTATVADATLTGSTSATATGGIAGVTAATLSGATFTDTNTFAPSTDFTVTAVAWGDGSTDTTGLTVTGSGGSYTVSGTHLYDEAGNYNFTITVTDNAGSTATITGTATVADATLTGSSSATATGGIAGVTAATLSGATFTDANTSAPSTDFTVTAVAWGDGSTDTTGLTVTGSGGSYTVSGTHLYDEAGNYNFTITVTDNAGSTATITGTATVADATLTGSSSATATGGIAGVTAATLSGATFTDANTSAPSTDFTVTAVAWGDGSTDTTGLTVTGSGGSYTVSGTHLYDEAGNYNFTITVTDNAGSTATITGTATVADATLTGSSSATATGGIAGVTAATLSGATFTDTNTFAPSTDFTVTAVAWGDGSTDTTGLTVTGSGGSYTVSGTHLYDEAGNYNFTITVTDNAGSTATITGTATVADATLTGSSSATATGGIAGVTAATLSGATFTDANTSAPSTDFTVTAVAWGDGSTDTTGLTVTGSGGSFTVNGTHLYDEAGNYNFTITVTDNAGSTATITGTATVADATLTGSSSATATGGIAGVTAATLSGATFTDTNTFAPSTDFTVTAVAWGDGSTDTTGLTVTGSAGSFTINGTHLYDEAGNYNFTITVTDNAGSTATITGTATVVNPVAITTTTLASYVTAGVAGYSQTIATTGGVAPITFAVSAGSLPAGISLNANSGVISGTPTTAGTFTFTVTATDNTHGTASQAYTVVVIPAAFVLNPITGALTITGNDFTFSEVTAYIIVEGGGEGISSIYNFTIDNVSQSFPDTVVKTVIVNSPSQAGTAILITNDTYKDFGGATQETRENISLGSKANAGVGTMVKYDANGNPYTFLTLSGFPVSYAYVGRNDGTVFLYGTAGEAYNGFVSAGNYSYIAGPGIYHEAQGATSVYGFSAGQATDFAYHYSANPGSTYVVSGTAYSYMSAMDTNIENGDTQAYFNEGVGFAINTGVSNNPGKDFAYIIDSPGNDNFVGGTAESYMYIQNANGSYAEFDAAYGFALVYADSVMGGTDTAINGDPSKNILSGNWHVE